MKPKITSLPEFTLMGTEARFISALSPDADNLVVIPALWTSMFGRRKDIGKTLDSFAYGAAKRPAASLRKRQGELVYLAGYSVDPSAKPPAGMVKWVIPEQTYALFTHRGPVSRLSETISYIYRVWMPQSEYQPADGPELERYDDRFIPGAESSETDFLVSIKPKAPPRAAASRRPAP
jgi:AraC family transcriptional regulator